MITLTHIARGGIFDHVGGGFCRYSTDARWMIPHFEKMLYDNGALLGVYADALSIGPDPLFDQAVRQTAEWLMREMQHPDGGYFSAIDADSEGEEGKFYVWRRDEIKRLLTADEYLDRRNAVRPRQTGELRRQVESASQRCVARGGRPARRFRATRPMRCSRARAQNCSSRAANAFRPDKDDKVLTAWNGIAIRGMAKAGLVLDEPKWIESATHAADFIAKRMVIDGQLYATWRDGHARHPRLSRRLREPARRFARAAASPLARCRRTSREIAGRHRGGAFLRQRRRRLLLHRERSRAADSPAQTVDRRRDAARQRRARASVESARASARRNALPRSRERHAEMGAHGDGTVSRRATARCCLRSKTKCIRRSWSSCAVRAPNSKAGCARCAAAIGRGATRSEFRTKRSV